MKNIRLIASAAVLSVVAGVTAFVKPWEGRELTPYRDIVGVWTWCDGETQGERKAKYTEAECDALTTDAVARHLRGVSTCIHKPLKENEWIAVGSWTYNVGVTAACKSSLVAQINRGVPSEVWCRQLLRWDRAGGRQVKGLTRRRQAEYAMCIGD